MKALATSRSARLSAGAVLALSAALLAPSRAAAAGCGAPRGMFHGHTPAAAPHGDSPLPAPDKPQPCSGPYCSASLPLPLSATPPAPPAVDPWGLSASAPAATDAGAERLRFDRVPDHPVRQPSSIFRPPR